MAYSVGTELEVCVCPRLVCVYVRRFQSRDRAGCRIDGKRPEGMTGGGWGGGKRGGGVGES